MDSICFYARVSTKHESQLYSFENQVQLYDMFLVEHSHENWEVYDRYFDKGITGTSMKKRKGFLRMIDDAKRGCFNTIITREASRFARNVQDTLNVSIDLVERGIRLIFIEDKLDTKQDEDWKSRLTQLAIDAEKHSKTQSVNAKAGQKISRAKHVLYGNGNVLGYDRVGKEYVINAEQAKVVRLIFDMCLRGSGSRDIQYELEKKNYLTSTGLENWNVATITRILRNSIYCGTVVYNKSYSSDYLHQKRILNKGEVEQLVVEDRVPAIVSKEDFARAQEILDSHKTNNKGVVTTVGKPPTTIFGKKLKCSCGYSMQKKKYHTYKDGHTAYCYQCYDQVNRGSFTSRKKHGVSVEGVCDTKIIPDWKLKLASYTIFDMLIDRREDIIDIIDKLLESAVDDDKNLLCSEQEFYEKEIEALKRRISKLMDLYTNEYITLNEFNEKKKEIDTTMNEYNAKLNKLITNKCITPKTISERLAECKDIITNSFMNYKDGTTYELLVDSFVDRIIVSNDKLEWHMRLTKEIKMPLDDVIREKEVFIGTLSLTKDDATYYSKYCNDLSRVCFDKALLVDIYLMF